MEVTPEPCIMWQAILLSERPRVRIALDAPKTPENRDFSGARFICFSERFSNECIRLASFLWCCLVYSLLTIRLAFGSLANNSFLPFFLLAGSCCHSFAHKDLAAGFVEDGHGSLRSNGRRRRSGRALAAVERCGREQADEQYKMQEICCFA